jgi:hypothetical protein
MTSFKHRLRRKRAKRRSRLKKERGKAAAKPKRR